VPTELELIRGCKRRHAPSQEGLYRRYWSFAMSVCLRYVPTREDALEIAHDAFLNAFRSIDRFDEARPFRAWFRRILVRCAIDRHRATRRYHASVYPEPDPPDAEVDPGHSITLEADEILLMLARLPDVQRAVFNLHEVEGYTHDEIAGLLDIAPGTSRAYLSRAKHRLEALYIQLTSITP
jgi:RNA polymerase sigma factor (sigma-70 family)